MKLMFLCNALLIAHVGALEHSYSSSPRADEDTDNGLNLLQTQIAVQTMQEDGAMAPANMEVQEKTTDKDLMHHVEVLQTATKASKHKVDAKIGKEGKAAEELNLPAPAMTNKSEPSGVSDMSKETSGSWDESVTKAIVEFEQAHPGEFDADFFKEIQGRRLVEAPPRLPTKAELNAMMSIATAAHEKLMELEGIHHAEALMDVMVSPLLNMSKTIMQFDQAHPGNVHDKKTASDEFSELVRSTGLGESPPRQADDPHRHAPNHASSQGVNQMGKLLASHGETADTPKKVTLVMMDTRLDQSSFQYGLQHADWLEMAGTGNLYYARKHGYSFVYMNPTQDHCTAFLGDQIVSRHPSWCKLLAVAQVAQNQKQEGFIMMVDSDALVRNVDFDLYEYLDKVNLLDDSGIQLQRSDADNVKKKASVFMFPNKPYSGGGKPCAGIQIWRTPLNFGLLSEWWNADYHRTSHPWEQAALWEIWPRIREEVGILDDVAFWNDRHQYFRHVIQSHGDGPRGDDRHKEIEQVLLSYPQDFNFVSTETDLKNEFLVPFSGDQMKQMALTLH